MVTFFQNLSSFSGHISKLYVYSGEFRTPAPNQRAVLYAINLKEQKFKNLAVIEKLYNVLKI